MQLYGNFQGFLLIIVHQFWVGNVGDIMAPVLLSYHQIPGVFFWTSETVKRSQHVGCHKTDPAQLKSIRIYFTLKLSVNQASKVLYFTTLHISQNEVSTRSIHPLTFWLLWDVVYNPMLWYI